MRTTTVVAASLVLSACVIANAFCLNKQIYPSIVYIYQSNLSMAVMYLQALIAVYLLGKLTCIICFGPIRAAESERLFKKVCRTVIETCVAFTLFQDDFGPKCIAQFFILLFLKCFHWLTEDRIDYMERTPFMSNLFHIRIRLLLILLSWADTFILYEAYTVIKTKGVSMQLVFGFEYALLIIMVINLTLKYVLHTLSVYTEFFWGSKAVLLLYVEFFIGFCKSMMYVTFFIVMIKINAIPYFAFRSMYLTYRNFIKALQDLTLSSRAIRYMNTQIPDATIQDLQAIENVCVICREDMTAAGAKKLPCNHIFHTSCLSRWFQYHQTCPTCRTDILRPSPFTQSSASAAVPPHARTAQDDAAASHSSPNMNDANNHGPSTSHHPNLPENMPQADANPPTIPINIPFVGGIAISPPPIPANLDNLSDEELRLMEQNTREACLARLKYVADVKSMLDAAIVMMNHYSSASLIAGFDSTESANDSSRNVTRTPDATENDKQLDIRSSSNTSEIHSSSEFTSSSSGSDDHLLPQEETELQRIVRLKRLEKFGNTGNNST